MGIKSTNNFITARFSNPEAGHLSPGAVSILTYTPEASEEVLSLSAISGPRSSHGGNQSTVKERSYQCTNSKDWPLEIHSDQRANKTLRSRKTSTTTILTEAVNDQPAFESDAFAVNMPTTREPAEAYNSPYPAQVAAYHLYAEKARRNASCEYHIEHASPATVSYDYAYENIPSNPHCVLEPDATPPSSPPTISPGAFPSSPPEPSPATSSHSSRSGSVIAPRHSIAHKPIGTGPGPRQSMKDNKINHRNASTGAEHPTRILPTKTKTRPTTRAGGHEPGQAHTQTHQQPLGKPWWYFSTPPHEPSPSSFSYKAPNAYALKEAPVSWHAAPHIHSSTPTPTRHRARSFGLAWLRPNNTRHNHSSNSASTTSVDSFAFASPSKRKLFRPLGPREEPRSKARGFDEWCESVQWAVKLIAKVCLVVYLTVGAWYVLDTMREVLWVVSWPGRMVWMVCRWVGEAWERFGIFGPRRY